MFRALSLLGISGAVAFGGVAIWFAASSPNAVEPSGERSAELDIDETQREEPVLAEPDLLKTLSVGVSDYASFLSPRSVEEPTWDPMRETAGPYTIEYSFDRELTRRAVRLLKRGRVKHGHVIVLDPRTGRVLAYVSTDAQAFPPQDPYPAASLVKIVTAAAGLRHSPQQTRRPCVYSGNPYRLTKSGVHRPKRGHTVSLERALASSNNRCFAQLAVDTLGDEALLEALDRFGWTRPPAPGHAAGSLDRGEGDYDLGRLGSGLAHTRITPLHAVQLAASLTSGEKIEPWWVDRILDADQRELALPDRPEPQRVMASETAKELRKMLVRTTTHGTARAAFRDRRGRPRLGDLKVAGKTGNLTGNSPHGRYEWFIGLAPADQPRVAIAVLQLQSNMWWSKSSEIAADLLSEIFCEKKRCEGVLADRFTGEPGGRVSPVLLSDPRGSSSHTDRVVSR